MSQTIRTKKTDVLFPKVNELLDDIQEKYKISKDVLLKYIDQARIDYQLDFYKIDIQMVEDEISQSLEGYKQVKIGIQLQKLQ